MSIKVKKILRFSLSVFLVVFIFTGLYLASRYSYLLFHSLVELFSIIVASAIFMFAWNSKNFSEAYFLTFLGISYLFIGAIDLVHTLSYSGMGVFQGYDTNLPTQLWIAARYEESIALLITPFMLNKKGKPEHILIVWALITLIILAAIFSPGIFPDCFIEGEGLTPFKVISEYIISGILFMSAVFFFNKRESFDPAIFKLILLSIFITILSEMAFTLYKGPYDLANLIGHYLKLLSFYLIYRATIHQVLERPYSLLFRTLKEERDRAQEYLEVAGVIIVVINPEGRVELINRKGCEILGFRENEIIGKNWFDNFLPERIREDIKNVFEKLMNRELELFEYYENPILTRSGEERLIAWHNHLLFDADGNIKSTISSGEDITERAEAEKKLKKSLEEKKLLLREIHHRVKNNIQVISSLLNLQASSTLERRPAEILKESRNRLRSMALIHDRLYQSEDLAEIDFADYTEKLLGNLFKSYGINTDLIGYRIEGCNINMDINRAIPCGLIINELVSNSLKYAFPRGRGGEIYISLSTNSEVEDAEKSYTLIVADNGVGFPKNFDLNKPRTLGLQLVLTLVKQLKGKLSLKGTPGTRFEITFE